MSAFVSLFNQVYQFLIGLLPPSPFRGFINAIDGGNIPWLAQLNWFFPVTECVAVLEAFVSVVAVYYLYQAIMRYVHLIK